MINSFDGKYYFLSNFYNSPVTYNGLTYYNNEAAFQAQKTFDLEIRKQFTNLAPGKAKRLGHQIKLRDDWEEVKVNIMYEICKCKFMQNSTLRQMLIDTHDKVLIEGNYWNDTFWGVCNGVGENNLGIILMKIRGEINES